MVATVQSTTETEVQQASSVQTQKEVKPDKRFPVMEIFGPTIQGEGSVIGVQTLFIRFGGCDYRCKNCDSLHAVIPEHVQAGATYMTADEIIIALSQYAHTGVRWVTFSGGNPLMHQLGDLVDRVHNELRMCIAVETQGTIWAEWLLRCEIVTVSPKAPGMGEKFEIDKFRIFVDNLSWSAGFTVKVVVFRTADLEFVASLMEEFPYLREHDVLYISLGNPFPPKLPGEGSSGFNTMELLTHYEILVEEILQDNRLRSAVVLPQWHVVLWGNKKGV